jgi:hypothetical protein
MKKIDISKLSLPPSSFDAQQSKPGRMLTDRALDKKKMTIDLTAR